MAKRQVQFRLSEEVLGALDGLTLSGAITRTEAVSRAILEASGRSAAPLPSADRGAVDALTAQLGVKDEQIKALTDALAEAQRTAQAAQVLQAQSVKALESAEKGQRRGLLDWIRGL